MTSTDALSLYLAAGGILGSLARAWITNGQDFRSRKTIADIVIGFFVGFLWPLYPLVEFPETATTLQKAVIVAAVAYITGDVLINAFGKLANLLNTAKGANGMKMILAVIAVVLALGGCLLRGPEAQYEGALECKGKVALTGNGSLSIGAGYGGSGTNAWTLQGDCGDGFKIQRSRERILPDAPAPVKP